MKFDVPLFCYDTETPLIGDSLIDPPMVCLQWVFVHAGTDLNLDFLRECCTRMRAAKTAEDIDHVLFEVNRHGIQCGIDQPDVGLDRIQNSLGSGHTIIGHNVSYDCGVICAERSSLLKPVWDAYMKGDIACTYIRDQMLDIALGQFRSHEEYDEDTGMVSYVKIGYNLTDMCERRINLKLDKAEDSWRYKYVELYGVDVSKWPRDAVNYALLDPLATLAVYIGQWEQWLAMVDQMAQHGHLQSRLEPQGEPELGEGERYDNGEQDYAELCGGIPDEALHTQAAWALHLTGGRGLVVDPDRVEVLADALRETVKAYRVKLAESGIYRPDGTKDTGYLKAKVTAAYEAMGTVVPMTEPEGESEPQVSTSRLTLAESEDPDLELLAECGKSEKLLTGFMPDLAKCANSLWIARYQPLLDSMRVSCMKPNIMVLPRLPGVRECIVPREGYCFCSVDLNSIELRTLAQKCLEVVGWSKLAELYQADPDADPHLAFAAKRLGITLEEAKARKKDPIVKSERQNAKPSNFGYPGGLGAKTWVKYAKQNYGMNFSLADAESFKKTFFDTWPEVREYHDWVNAQIDKATNRATSRLGYGGSIRTWSGRGGTFASLANDGFQRRACRGAKPALVQVAMEGPARDIHPVVFLHDEIIAEVPIKTAHESAMWIKQVMEACMQVVIPDIPARAEASLMDRWYKGNEPVYLNGRLVPWSPELVAAQSFGGWIKEKGVELVAA